MNTNIISQQWKYGSRIYPRDLLGNIRPYITGPTSRQMRHRRQEEFSLHSQALDCRFICPKPKTLNPTRPGKYFLLGGSTLGCVTYMANSRPIGTPDPRLDDTQRNPLPRPLYPTYPLFRIPNVAYSKHKVR